MLCLLLQNDITTNCRYTAPNEYLLLFFLKILSHICTHNYAIHFIRCFAPVICVSSHGSAGEQGTEHPHQREQVQSEIKFARYPPTLCCAMMHVLISSMQKASSPCMEINLIVGVYRPGGLKHFTDFYSRSMSQVKIPFCFPST